MLSALPTGESTIRSEAPALKLVIEGEEIHEIDGKPFVLGPGRMLLVDRGAPYRTVVRRAKSTLGMCVYLPFRSSEYNIVTSVPGRAIMQASEADALGRFLTACATSLHRSGQGQKNLAEIMGTTVNMLDETLTNVNATLSRLRTTKASTRSEIFGRLERARAYLYGNSDRAVPLAELAVAAGMSGFQLTRYFTAAYGAPPARFHRTVRLERAAERLRSEIAPISEIALAAGYGDLSAFDHAFKREFGRSPRILRALKSAS